MSDTRHPVWARNAVFLFAGTFVALTILVGPMHQAQFANDVTTFLDACQRLYAGQRLHFDFQSPLGATAFAPFVAAMWFTGADARALPLGAAFCLGGFSLWAWVLSRSRLAPAAAVTSAAFIGLLGGSAYALDFGGWDRPSYAMFYNRMAWALLLLVAVECSLPARTATPRTETGGAVSTGAALGLLLLLKINFAVVAALFAVIATLLSGRARWTRLVAVSAGALVAALILEFVAPYSVTGYARELAGLAEMQKAGTFWPIALRVLHDNAIALGLTAAGLISLWWVPLPRVVRWQISASIVLLVGAGLTLSLANCQYAELPIFATAILIAAEWVFRVLPQSPSTHAWQLAALLPALIYAAPNAALPLRELLWQRSKAPLAPADARIHTASLQRLILTPWPGEPLDPAQSARLWDGGSSSPYSFAQWLNDGLALLRPHIHPGALVLSMDWSNPFPFALDLSPPRGDHIAWHWGRVVSDQHHPAPEQLFAKVDFVMVPKFGAQPDSIAAKLRVYGPTLRANFHPVAASEIWTLWARTAVPELQGKATPPIAP